MGKKTDRLGGRYGGEPDKAIADPGNEDVENPVIQSSINGGSNKSIRRPKEESKMPKFKEIVEGMLTEGDWDKTMREAMHNYAKICSRAANEIEVKCRISNSSQLDTNAIRKAAQDMQFKAGRIMKYVKSYEKARGDHLSK